MSIPPPDPPPLPDNPSAGRYVLIRLMKGMEAFLYGQYDIRLVCWSGEEPLDPARHEVIEFGKNASAAEWLRLAKVRDSLLEACEVMDS